MTIAQGHMIVGLLVAIWIGIILIDRTLSRIYWKMK